PQVQIGPVENHDLPGPQARAQLPRLAGVAVTGRVHDGKAGQKALEVEIRRYGMAGALPFS
ncbi:MAG TPA: hypothetical protein VHH88_10960, partial [Verrucomicrobiae bacterium]|nr:hypothetical protein [Verrucomicrobiae bacterium]